jgi:hypothetical protein
VAWLNKACWHSHCMPLYGDLASDVPPPPPVCAWFAGYQLCRGLRTARLSAALRSQASNRTAQLNAKYRLMQPRNDP